LAGIGFQLKKLLGRRSLLGSTLAYGYAAVISTGPWLMAILALGGLTLVVPAAVSEREMWLFRAIVIFAYAVSFVMLGPYQLPLTRHLADRIYLKDYKSIVPIFFTSLLLGVSVQAVAAAFLFGWADAPPLFTVLAVALTVVISLVWHAMIFLSAARDYASIVKAFAIGVAASLGAGWFLGTRMGGVGSLMGFLAGQALLWFLLMRRVLAEFLPTDRVFDMSAIGALKRFPALAVAGLFYNAGLWIDKVVYWEGAGMTVSGILRAYPPYDTALFVAYLSTVPAFSVFLVRVETEFYDEYRRFYATILAKRTYPEIAGVHAQMGRVIGRGLLSVLKLQGTVTALCLLFSGSLVQLLGLDPACLGIFRIGLLSALAHVLFQFTLVILLYFDARGLALGISAAFCLLNAGLSALALKLGYAFTGYGILLACMISFALAYAALVHLFRRLPFLTFARQPIQAPGPEPSA
jgi:uncharacterized membrane protein